MLIGSDTNLFNLSFPANVRLAESNLSISSHVKNLVVVFDQKLTMKPQLNRVKGKTIGNLCNIARISNFIDRKRRTLLMHGLVLSQLDYCNSLYYGLPNCDIHGARTELPGTKAPRTEAPWMKAQRQKPQETKAP